MLNILIVDDDVTFTLILKRFLGRQNYVTEVAHTVKDAVSKIQHASFDLFLFDYRLPDGTGLELLSTATALNKKVPVIIMTSFNDVRTAVKAMRMGVFDYITKPVNQDEILMLIEQATGKLADHSDEQPSYVLPSFVAGISDAYQKVQEQIKLIAPTDLSAIIQGESGTGKEYLARLIHSLSPRSANSFIAIDCGTLTRDLAGSELFGHLKGAFTGAVQTKKGKLEEANGGTLFLDEIGNLSYEVQIKLLRVIQERVIQPLGSNREVKIDVRIIAASNDDLWLSVQQGNFREDLYHRLNEFKVKIPPLREREADFQLFVDFFIEESNRVLHRNVSGISKEVQVVFTQYDWPGNIRELKNIIKRMVLLTKGEIAEMDTLPEEMLLHLKGTEPRQVGTDLKALQELNEKEMIEKALQQVKYNKSKAAKLLNIDRSTLYAKMEKYNISS